MGLFYTKRNDEQERKDKTVQAEEFVNLMTSMKRGPMQLKERPKTESI